MLKNQNLLVSSILLACMAIAYANCTTNYSIPCVNPPLGGPQTGVGKDSKGCAVSYPDCYVTTVPYKPWVTWVDSGRQGYAYTSIQCEASGGTYLVAAPCNWPNKEYVSFTVKGAAENRADPSGTVCPLYAYAWNPVKT
jgi:hypothetical protein